MSGSWCACDYSRKRNVPPLRAARLRYSIAAQSTVNMSKPAPAGGAGVVAGALSCPAPVALAAPQHGDAERDECAVVATKVNPNEGCRGIDVDARALRRRNMWTRADRTLAPDSRHIVAFRSSDTTFRAADKSS